MEAIVSRVLSKKRLVLNAGTDKGVSKGDTFIIYELGEEILDPSTGDSLGVLEINKGEVEVIQVQERMCMVQTLKRRFTHTKVVDPFDGIHPFAFRRETTEVLKEEEMEVAETDSNYQEKLRVKIGDKARRIEQ